MTLRSNETVLCTDNSLDSRTKCEKDATNQHQKGEHQRREHHRGGQHRTTLSCSSRSDAVRQPDNTDTLATGEDNDLTTQFFLFFLLSLKISVVLSNRPCDLSEIVMLQGHRYLGVPDPRRTETFESQRRHPDSQNPHL